MELVFLRVEIIERWGWGKVLAAKNIKSVTRNSGQTLNTEVLSILRDSSYVYIRSEYMIYELGQFLQA